MNVKAASDLNKIIDANSRAHFSIDFNTAAFLSFDTSLLVDPKNKLDQIVLSLFLEDGKFFGEISEFIIYPVDTQTKQVGDRGLAVKTKTKKGNFVDFVLAPEIFASYIGKSGFIIRTTEMATFQFVGPDIYGTTQDPHLTIEHGVKNIDQEFIDLPKDQQTDFNLLLLGYAKEAAINSRKQWYEKPYFMIPLGFVLGILSSIAYAFLKKVFPNI